MPRNHESSYEEQSEFELQEQEQRQLNDLLYQSLEFIQFAKAPENTTVYADNAPFGAIGGDCSLSFSFSRVNGDYTEGRVNFEHSDSPDRSFNLHNTSLARIKQSRALWVNRDLVRVNAPLSSASLLRHLHRNWPIDDADYPPLQDALAVVGTGRTTLDMMQPLDVLNLLDTYLAGKHPDKLSYDTKWNHVFDAFSQSDDVAAFELQLQRDEGSQRHHLAAKMQVIEEGTPETNITYEIVSDELGTVTISADHHVSPLHPHTDRVSYRQPPEDIDTELLAIRLESTLRGLRNDLS